MCLVSNPTLQYNGQDVKISHLPNPSHLEAVNPVALGKTRAKQFALLKKLFGVSVSSFVRALRMPTNGLLLSAGEILSAGAGRRKRCSCRTFAGMLSR